MAEQKEKGMFLVKFRQESEFSTYSSLGIADEEVIHEFKIARMIECEITEELMESLNENPDISYVERTIPVYAYQQDVPYGIGRVQAPEAHEKGHAGSGVKLGIVDTGIDAAHEDLNVEDGFSAFDSGEDSAPYSDGSGHGTHVAGTAAAIDNETGVVGVAPEASLYAIKVLDGDGSGSSAGVVRGLEWAIQNEMGVINMSLGSPEPSRAIQDAVDIAFNEHDILVVAAAGNEGNEDGTGNTVGYPAQYESVLAVAATDENDTRAPFSSTGPGVDIAAPGASVLSTVPGNGYDRLDGTSMAAPHAAGAGAVLRAAFPDESAAEIKERIISSAEGIGDNPEWYGSGLLQLLDAVNR
ncbi:S8 family peptidase [Salinicoccus carnicancri]|uniref:S8 family peptidase n=1 Tax=Salinicoccus carnicancri TaxID=558170 RepID=UPI0002D607F9|nr:S8 family peptidase [Salinicoccus carnicancri]